MRNITFDELVATYGECDARAAQGWRGSDPGRDHLRHAEREGRVWSARVDAIEASGEDMPIIISGTITDASGRTLVGPDDRSVLELDPACAAARRRPELRARREAAAALRRGARAARRLPMSARIRTPACPTPSANTTRRRRKRRRSCEEFAASGFVNIVGGCCGTTPEHIRTDRDSSRAPSRRASPAQSRARCACAASSRSIIGTDSLFVNVGRAHQRHRLRQVPQADRGGRLRRRRSTSRASRSRTARRSST